MFINYLTSLINSKVYRISKKYLIKEFYTISTELSDINDLQNEIRSLEDRRRNYKGKRGIIC